MPEVSVIIPSYNYGIYLTQCLDSLMSQSHRPFEIIVVDDGSTDGTQSIVSSYTGGPLRYVYQENKGACSARNKGFRLSSGEYVMFLDADDCLLPSALETMVHAFSGHDRVGVVYADYFWVDETGKAFRRESEHRNSYEGDIHPYLKHECFIAPSAALIRRRCLETDGEFDERLPCFQDWDLFYRISDTWTFSHIAEPLMLYRVHPDVPGIWNDHYGNKINKTKDALNHIIDKYSYQSVIPTAIHQALSGLYLEKNDDEQAESVVKDGLHLDSHNLYLRIRLIDILYARKKNQRNTLREYDDIYHKAGSNERLKKQILLKSGKVCVENKQMEKALGYLDQILEIPDSRFQEIQAEALLNKGIIYHEQHDYISANRLFEKLICEPENKGVHEFALIYHVKCLIYFQMFDQAEQRFRTLVSHHGNKNTQTRLIEAQLAQNKSDHLKALKAYNVLLRQRDTLTAFFAASGVLEILLNGKCDVFNYLKYIDKIGIIPDCDRLKLCESAALFYEKESRWKSIDLYTRMIHDIDRLPEQIKTTDIRLMEAKAYRKTGRLSKSMALLKELKKSRDYQLRVKAVTMMADMLMDERALTHERYVIFLDYITKHDFIRENDRFRLEYRYASHIEAEFPLKAFQIFKKLQRHIKESKSTLNNGLLSGIYYHKGLILYNHGKYAEAITWFEKCRRLMPDHVMAGKYIENIAHFLCANKPIAF